MGCAPSTGSIIAKANRENDARAVERGSALLTGHLKLIEKLRADGDPMGDYLWTRANADQWVENPIKDPLVLKKMYEAAAEKGSIDAQHVLGLMLFDGSASRSGVCTDCPVLKPEDRDWRKGLAIIEDATKKQCYYWAIVLDGMANSSCLRPSVSSGEIWPEFRDGRIVDKNQEAQSSWKVLRRPAQTTSKRYLPPFSFGKNSPHADNEYLSHASRLGGRITAANIAFDDRPNDRWFPTALKPSRWTRSSTGCNGPA
jgi:hypothetical protein